MDGRDWERLDQLWHDVHRRVRTEVRRAVQEVLPGAAGGAGFGILALLARCPEMSPSELAHRMDVRSSTMTAHLDRLEELGWIERVPAEGRGARVAVRLTAAGREARERYVAVRRRVLGQFLAPLDGEDQARLLAMLSTVGSAMDRRSAGKSGDSSAGTAARP